MLTLTSSQARSEVRSSVIHFGAETDVVGDGAAEEEWILQDDAEALAKFFQVLLAHVDAIDEECLPR